MLRQRDEIHGLVLKHMKGRHNQQTHGREGLDSDKDLGKGWQTSRPTDVNMARFLIGDTGSAFAPNTGRVNRKVTDHTGFDYMDGTFYGADNDRTKADYPLVDLYTGKPSPKQIDQLKDTFPEIEEIRGKGFDPISLPKGKEKAEPEPHESPKSDTQWPSPEEDDALTVLNGEDPGYQGFLRLEAVKKRLIDEQKPFQKEEFDNSSDDDNIRWRGLLAYRTNQFGRINDPLRRSKGDPSVLKDEEFNTTYREPGSSVYTESGEIGGEDAVKGMDSLLGDVPLLDEDLYTWRGVNMPEMRGMLDRGELDGLSFTDHGYVSSTIKPATVPDFVTSPEDSVLIKMRIPEGSRAFYMDAGAANAGEGEVLLPRGGHFKILRTGNERGYPVAYVEYLGNTASEDTFSFAQKAKKQENVTEMSEKYSWKLSDVVWDKNPETNSLLPPVVLPQDKQNISQLVIGAIKHMKGKHNQKTHGRRARFAARGFFDATPEDIARLKIPKGWRDVQINPEKGAPLLAVGSDAKGREQRIYSAEHHEKNAAAKFARVAELHSRMGEIDNRLEADAKDNDTALAALMIRRMGLRPGSDKETLAEKKAYGATTLLADHAEVDGDNVRLAFTGKKGVPLDLSTEDPDLAGLLKERLKDKEPGDKLLDTSDSKLRDYMKEAAPGVKPKDFRTYLGTTAAMEEMKAIPPPKTKKEYQTKRKAVGEAVSKLLGNTPSVALESYIAPAVFGPWDKVVA